MRHSSRSCATPVGTILRLGVGAVALCAVLPALAEVGPYVGLEAGFSINPRMPLTQSSTLTTTTSSGSITSSGTAHGDVDMSNGAVGGATFGYALPGHLRPELEVNYRRNTAKDTGTGVSAIAVMGNVWYDFEQNHSYFYMGGGIGDLHLHMTVDDHGDTSDAFGGQLGAGAGFFITPQLSVGVDYRYAT
ncbi:MAG TPA: outer membrane beta-barrel protein, partial [Nevskiaceae bacterium]|nr:outer membrane beta-barrel protein [Nevskiaceae bacterium]